jgi:hypothetical protein
MMVLQRDLIDSAKISRSVGFVTRITSPHSRTGAELGEAESTLKALVFLRYETKIEIHVVGDEYPIIHELHEAVGHFGKQRGRPPSCTTSPAGCAAENAPRRADVPTLLQLGWQPRHPGSED